MASNVVRVSTSEANSGVNNFNNKLADLNTKIKAMRTRAYDTETWWEGETGRSFRESFDRACSFFEQTLTKKLQDHAQRMLKSVEAQHTQDSTLASRIKRH
jgi:uncharacterized protein YukE